MKNKIDEKQMLLIMENARKYSAYHCGFETLKVVTEKTDDGTDVWLHKIFEPTQEIKRYHLGQLKE